MTLTPVSNISVFDSSSSKFGALRWMVQRSPSYFSSAFSTSPRVLNTLPLVKSPTGTEMPVPVSVTAAWRTRPSVGCMEIVRTRPSPRCWATSRVSVFFSPALAGSATST